MSNNFNVAKRYLEDVQAVVTDALNNLDRLPEENEPVSSEVPWKDVKEMCRCILTQHCGMPPTEQMVITLYNAIRDFVEDNFLPKD